jgi:uncharacterized membrane protein SpoIIM required for sporulation
MQETEFIKQNRHKWDEFEKQLMSADKNPDRLSSLYIETTDDLSYAQTYYRFRSIRVYLNGVARQAYQAIYRNRPRMKGTFSKFWREELPSDLWHFRNQVYLSLAIFIVGLVIGVSSSIYYPQFAQIILGDGYVEMTEANIEKGDPMAVYKNENTTEMFFRIAGNNIRLAFLVFALGFAAGIGTVYIVFYNAIMVGTFIYFFIERGLFIESFLAIMLHGTLELSMIVMSGAAGLMIASGILFPGTYKRSDALMKSGRSAIRLMMVVFLFLLYAAAIETFLTRYTDIQEYENGKVLINVMRFILILLSTAIVAGYFFFYPYYLRKRGRIQPAHIEELPPSAAEEPQPYLLKSAGKITVETFYFFSKNIRFILASAFWIALTLTIAYGLSVFFEFQKVEDSDFQRRILKKNPLSTIWVWWTYKDYFNFFRFPLQFVFLVLCFSFFAIGLWTRQINSLFSGIKISWNFSRVVKILLFTTVALSPLWLSGWLKYSLVFFSYPIALLGIYRAFDPSDDESDGVTFIQFVFGNFLNFIGVYFLFLVLQWLCLFLLYSRLISMLISIVVENLPFIDGIQDQVISAMMIFMSFFLLAVLLSWSLLSIGIYYHSTKERITAQSLLKRISTFSPKRNVYGVERE